jgi:hypothetical protein
MVSVDGAQPYVPLPKLNRAEHGDLFEHIKSCTARSSKKHPCHCSRFLRNFDTWGKRLPINPLADADPSEKETWLWYTICNEGRRFDWNCVICEKAYKSPCRDRRAGHCNVANMLRHSTENHHIKAVAKLLRVSPESLGCRNLAPPLEMFRNIFTQFQEGRVPSQGFVLPGGEIVEKEKAKRLVWDLSESNLQMQQDHMRVAECANLLRDERHGRLHCRFRCTNADIETHAGYMGQSRDFEPDATGITAACKEVYTEFCTKFIDPPSGAVVRPQLDATLFEHIRTITEAVSTDSASNEVTAVQDSRLPSATNRKPAFLPNCDHILRDGAHSARRVLSRPWKADEVLDEIVGLFCQWRDSMGQLVHHSYDLKRLYKQCVADCAHTCPLSTMFQNLRSAKHRFETLVTPLSRCVLNLDALILFAVRLSQIRKGKREGKAALVFLESLCVPVLLLLGLMADAGTEALHLIRLLDTEDVPLEQICDGIEAFLDRQVWLFHSKGVFQIRGHTAHIMEWLKTSHFFEVGDAGKCLGGVAIAEGTVETCLSHMRSFVVLARSVLHAEFPKFGLVSAFGAFKLSDTSSSATVVAGALPDHRREQLVRLSQCFSQPKFEAQFVDHLPFAVAALQKAGGKCTHLEAWREGIRQTQAIRGGELGHPCGQLKFVLKRASCYCPSTSRVEQSFAKVESKLGDRRLNGSSQSEVRSISLLLLNPTEAELVHLCSLAREIHARAFPIVHRAHTKRRRDKGVQKAPRECKSEAAKGKPTERRFLRRLHAMVVSLAPSGGSCNLKRKATDVWTEKHEKEEKFQMEKRRKRMVEAAFFLMQLLEESPTCL